MKKYKIIIPEMEFTVNAEDENDAEHQAIGLFDWGNVDMEVEETKDFHPKAIDGYGD